MAYFDKIQIGSQSIDVRDTAATQNIVNLTKTVNANYNTLNTSITNANSEIESLTNSISNVSTKIKNFDFSRVVFIGDSYLTGLNLSSPSTQNYGYLLAQKLNCTDKYFFAENGAGFTATGTAGHTFSTLLNLNYSKVSSPSTITAVIILGGVNDGTTAYGTQSANVKAFLNQCKSLFSNAKIHVFITPNYDVPYKQNTLGIMQGCLNLDNVFQHCESWYWLVGQEAYYGSDYLHPNATGASAIANYMYDTLFFGKQNSYQGGYWGANSGTGGLFWSVTNGVLHIKGTGNDTSQNNQITLVSSLPRFLVPRKQIRKGVVFTMNAGTCCLWLTGSLRIYSYGHYTGIGDWSIDDSIDLLTMIGDTW